MAEMTGEFRTVLQDRDVQQKDVPGLGMVTFSKLDGQNPNESQTVDQVFGLLYDNWADVDPKKNRLDDRKWFSSLRYTDHDIATIGENNDKKVIAVVMTSDGSIGTGDNKKPLVMIEATSTDPAYRGKGLREALVRRVIDREGKDIAIGVFTWRVDTIAYPNMPSDYPEEEKPVHETVEELLSESKKDLSQYDPDILRRIKRGIHVHESNTNLGFRMVQKSDGTRDPYHNYLRVTDPNGLAEIGYQENAEGERRILKLREVLQIDSIPVTG